MPAGGAAGAPEPEHRKAGICRSELVSPPTMGCCVLDTPQGARGTDQTQCSLSDVTHSLTPA